MPGSGKSIGAVVGAALEIPVIVMGDVVRDEATRQNLVHTPETLGKIMLELREKFGSAIVADRCVVKIKKIESPNIIIDGVRNKEEVKQFRKIVNFETSIWFVYCILFLF